MLPDGTLPNDYVVLDLETTGVSWYRDTIIEFGAVKVVDRKPVDTYQQLVNPMRNLNPFITQLTGITPDMLEPAPKKRKPGPKGPGEKEKREGDNCGVTLSDLAGSCRQPPYHSTILEAVL